MITNKSNIKVINGLSETIRNYLLQVTDGNPVTCKCGTTYIFDFDAVNNEEEIILKRWIRNEWCDCENLRNKIDNEGTGYFYDSYTNVPVSYDTYTDFAHSYDCWCGQCDSNSIGDEEYYTNVSMMITQLLNEYNYCNNIKTMYNNFNDDEYDTFYAKYLYNIDDKDIEEIFDSKKCWCGLCDDGIKIAMDDDAVLTDVYTFVDKRKHKNYYCEICEDKLYYNGKIITTVIDNLICSKHVSTKNITIIPFKNDKDKVVLDYNI